MSAAVVVIMLAVLGRRSYEQQRVIEWSRWINTVHIACQPGSDEQVVERMLGRPGSVHKPSQLAKRGFSPRPVPVPGAEKVYVYTRVFPLAGGVWVTYVFIGPSGKVLGFHLATS